MREPTQADFDAVFGGCERDGTRRLCYKHRARYRERALRCDHWQDMREEVEAVLDLIWPQEERYGRG